MTIELGGYRLGARLGRGGMGEVWQAIHVPTSRPVAVKVLHRASPHYVRGVRVEARAIAALDHPHVVALLDIGVVPQGTPAMPAGSPFLVMELVEGGDLRRQIGSLTWPEIRRVCDDLLDALSHAHARGIIHRDVKPANVLRARPGATRPGWRLTDFGLAHGRFDASASVREGPRGSPRYMAPEQFIGFRRDLGPWTDLYGLGCLIWEAVCGTSVFRGDSLEQLRDAHLNAPPPEFTPRFDVPDELETWLRTCLSKRTVDRFLTAPDAAHALRRLDRGLPMIAPSTAPSPSVAETTYDFMVDTTPTEILQRAPRRTVAAAHRPRNPSAPPHPPSFRHDVEHAPRAPLASSSLAMVLLRRPPFLGRDAERGVLWDALGRVHRSGRPELVVLTGAPGMGETRLARWLVHRARETGSARGLFIHHGEAGEGGASELVADALHLHGLSREQSAERLIHLAQIGIIDDHTDREALLDILSAGDPSLPAGRRHAAVLALLLRISGDRPLLLVLDDAHRSDEARTWMRLLVENEVPALIVATGQPPGAADDPQGAAELLALTGELGGMTITLERLDPVACKALVGRMADLDDALAQRLEARSQGHPQLLVETLVGWVREGQLEAGPRGFRLIRGAELRLPSSLDEVVKQHLSRALRDRSPSEAWAVEVAAVLGDRVDVRTWAATCLLAGASPAEDLVQHLVESGIWRREEEMGGGLRFTSSLLRSVIIARASAAGRLPSHHRAAALHLAREGGSSERLGLHHLRAGEHAMALEPLLRAAEDEVLARDVGEAARIASWLQEALEALPTGAYARIRARAHLIHATLHVLRGAGPDAGEDLDAADALARAHRWPDILARVDLLRGRRAIRQRRFTEAISHLGHAAERALHARDRRLMGRAHAQRGSLLLYLGRLAEAEAELLAARPLARSHPADLAKVLLTQARAATQRGDRAEARRLLSQAKPWFDAAGSAWGPVAVRDQLCRLDRLEGRLDRAATGYLEVHQDYRRLGLRQADVALLHAALVDLERDRTEAARASFDHLTTAFETQRAPVLATLAWAGRLCGDAAAADAGAFDEAIERLRAHMARRGPVHPELASTLERAQQAAQKRLDATRAAAARALAVPNAADRVSTTDDSAFVGGSGLDLGVLQGEDVFALTDADMGASEAPTG